MTIPWTITQSWRPLGNPAQTDYIKWLESAERTTNQSSGAISLKGYSGVSMRITCTAWTAGYITPRIYDDKFKIIALGSPFGAINIYTVYFSSNLAAVSISGSPKAETKVLIPLATIKLGIAVGTADPITYAVDYQLIP